MDVVWLKNDENTYNTDEQYNTFHHYEIEKEMMFESFKQLIYNLILTKNWIFKIIKLSSYGSSLLIYNKTNYEQFRDNIEFPAIFTHLSETNVTKLKELIPDDLLFIDFVISATQGIVREVYSIKWWNSHFKNKKSNSNF